MLGFRFSSTGSPASPSSKGTDMLYFRWLCELATHLAVKFGHKVDKLIQNMWLDCGLYLQLVIYNGQDDGGISRRVEAALLAHLSSEESFPCKDKSARVLPMLADHLNLTLREEDPQTWSAVEAVFKRAHPWAVSHVDVFILVVDVGCVIAVAVGGVGVGGSGGRGGVGGSGGCGGVGDCGVGGGCSGGSGGVVVGDGGGSDDDGGGVGGDGSVSLIPNVFDWQCPSRGRRNS